MNRSTARRIAPALVALALVAGCAGATDDDASSGSGGSVNAQVCSGYADLQKSVEDLGSTPLRTSGTLEEIQASAAALEPKAAKLKADLNRLSAISNGPVAILITGSIGVRSTRPPLVVGSYVSTAGSTARTSTSSDCSRCGSARQVSSRTT